MARALGLALVTTPRYILPEQVVFVTRRTHQRRMRLVPDAATNGLLSYLIAALAPRFGIGVWGVVVMSNHYHLGIVDHEGRLPAFLQLLDALLARALNLQQGRKDSLWSGDKPHVAVVADEGAVFEKLGYMAANPVAARLVEQGRDWPGVRTSPQDFGSARTYPRPTFFFDPDGRMPAEATLTLEVPAMCAHHGAGGFHRLACDAVAAAESEARLANAGKPYLGAARCRAVDPMDEPKKREAGGRRRAGSVIATDEASRKDLDAALEAFLAVYAETRARFLAGERDVHWPRGAYYRVVIDRCPCHDAPGPAG